MFIQRFNKRVAWCVSYGHKDFFLSLFPLLSLYSTFFLWYRLSYTKTICQNALTRKKRRDKSQGNFSIENYYALQDAWWCLSLSLSCVYTDSIELFWGLCVCVYNCGSKADGMRIHQLAALHCVVLVWNVFLPFFLFELKILIFHHHRVIKLERNASLFPP